MKYGLVETWSVYQSAPGAEFQVRSGLVDTAEPFGGEFRVGAGGGSIPVPPVVV